MAENEAEVKRWCALYQLTHQVDSCAPAARAARAAATAARSAAMHSAAIDANRESEAYTPWELKRIGCLFFILLVWHRIGGKSSGSVHLVDWHIVRVFYAAADFMMLDAVNLCRFVTLTLWHFVTP